MDPTWFCNTCKKTQAKLVEEAGDSKEVVGLSRCPVTKSLFYCNRECQKKDWKNVKEVTTNIKKMNEQKQGFLKTIEVAGEEKTTPAVGAEVFVHYTGKLPNGTVFDSSRNKQPFSFILGTGQVIRGWDEGVKTMNKGERATLYVSPAFGYGEDGSPPSIPGNSYLIFDVELIEHRRSDLLKTGTNFL